ncbi:MAG: adenylate/guanylate cyclase domain-containing protein [Gammaproteobacteria bacterium]|jgi:class 3 adenylate cyclase|nr:adenylate/guanylate cyclase domain-containing protein [Gammaproteobacteria bacterium]
MTFAQGHGRLRAHTVLVLVVFVAFLLNAIGVLEIPLGGGRTPQLRSDLLGDIFGAGLLPPPLLGSDFLTFVCVGIVLSVLLPMLNPVKASVATFALMLPPFYVEYANPGVSALIPMEYTLLTILVLFSVNVLITYFVETHDKQKLIAVFGQYVPPEVVSAISRKPQTYSLDGEARELTVLFCDIRDFSTISEQLDPRQLAQMLNLYFTEMSDILHRHGATIDKYMGDAIMAFWGAPLAQDDHPVRAVNAGIAMLGALNSVNARFAERQWPPIDFGIGINTGIMNVGNMGSRYRIAYTVVGDAVNLGARLEGLTRIYDTKLVVSEATKMANPDFAFRELDHVRVKGKGLATRIFEPICSVTALSEERKQLLADHARATSVLRGRLGNRGRSVLGTRQPLARLTVLRGHAQSGTGLKRAHRRGLRRHHQLQRGDERRYQLSERRGRYDIYSRRSAAARCSSSASRRDKNRCSWGSVILPLSSKPPKRTFALSNSPMSSRTKTTICFAQLGTFGPVASFDKVRA